MTSRILIVDDEPSTRMHLKALLELDAHEVEVAASASEALKLLQTQSVHLMITDLYMPSVGGLKLLNEVRERGLPLGVILLTAYGETEVALEAMKAGADDFVSKPIDPDRFRLLVDRTLRRRRLLDELLELQQQISESYSFHNMLSKSPKMRKVFDLIEQVGPLGSTVLIQGETGTGKELVARAVHAASHRSGGPFVAVNCTAFNESLIESELFGHERGAFTGADRTKAGRFERAHNGTLFLDEIGEISPSMQAKLLRVLQTGEIERLGGTETIKVDVRIVAASNRRLDEMSRRGTFRSDLFYRLRVVPIELPPLRERSEDISLLALHFLQESANRSTPPVNRFSNEAMQALYAYSWPGNIRELENAVKAAVALAEGTVIRPEDLPRSIYAAQGSDDHDHQGAHHGLLDLEQPLPQVIETVVSEIERNYFLELLTLYRGNVARSARHSGLSRRCVTQKLQKYGLDRSQFRANSISINGEGFSMDPDQGSGTSLNSNSSGISVTAPGVSRMSS